MKKKSIFAVMLASTCLFLNATQMECLQAYAQTNYSLSSFVMQEGAAVRLKNLTDENGNIVESNGLQFAAEISPAEYTALKQAGARFGAVIVAKDLLKNTEINAETVFGENPAFYFNNETGGDTSKISMLHIPNAGCYDIDEDPNIEIYGSIVNIKLNNFTRSFVGRIYAAIPYTDAQGETKYTYHFAPYFNDDINNNSRCIYYVAQRAVETEAQNAAILNEKYILPFAETDRYKNYTYRYFVEHCYIVHNPETNEHEIAYTKVQPLYGVLNSKVTAEPIVKPTPEEDPLAEAIKDLNFIYDIDASLATNTGLVYAAGMQTLRLYYETAGTISEQHRFDSLAALLKDFLDVNKAGYNFGLHVNGDGFDEVWTADKVMDPNDPEKQIGIKLIAGESATKNRHLLLSKHFFDHLRAFGVESVSFDFHSSKDITGGMKFDAYQEEYYHTDGEADHPLPIYDENGVLQEYPPYNLKRVMIKIADVTPDGGVLIEIDQSMSSNKGEYHFGHVEFHFPTTNTAA
ncbi:MAG: hypothetical protein IKB20_03895 [Clostridia bacterium]|nr:hypothetical protein [Clostridia bacterium]